MLASSPLYVSKGMHSRRTDLHLITNVLDNSFSGKYFALSSETFPDKIMFRETKESDTFKTTTIVSELSVTQRFSVNKVELDEILMTIN